ncbi:hypothetical protein ACFY3G_46955 [Streptomyces phaeochromogenes]|uniref:hypothetical protein n=1 Tax=Streptomyces phaeochromogenes TaxID=1923 RepID=UPI00369D4738
MRVNPVFHVAAYSWDKLNGDKATMDTWPSRGREQIYSYGYYIDGTSDKPQQKLDPKTCDH